jgi:IAA-amino acid hydrolase
MQATSIRHVAATLLLALLGQHARTAAAPLSSWLDSAAAIEPWIIERQTELHRIPELLFDTPKTYAALEKTLTDIGVKYRRQKSGRGIIAEIGTGKPPIVVLRSDIDGLPIREEGSAPVKSEHDGQGHMCGHDGHMAMLLGGARLLHDAESSLKGTARLMFQPAEEGGAGGDVMVKEGALDGAQAAFGFHVIPQIPSGIIGSKVGAILAGAHTIKITIEGHGGHAAMPHTTKDPVVAAAATVMALQTIVSRETDPLDSSVISVTQFDAGKAHNVIPDRVVMGGTVRALNDEWMAHLRQRIEEVVKHQAASYGCSGSVDWVLDTNPYYPALRNDKGAHEFAMDVATRMLGQDRVDSNTQTLMAGEDFAFIAKAKPSAFLFLGIKNETVGSVYGLHNSKFKLDQTALKTGAAMHAALASEWLKTHAAAEEQSDEL